MKKFVVLSLLLLFSGSIEAAPKASLCMQVLSGIALGVSTCVSGCSSITHSNYRGVYRGEVHQERDDLAESNLLARERDFELYMEDVADLTDSQGNRLEDLQEQLTLATEREILGAAELELFQLRSAFSALVEARTIYDLELLGNPYWARRSARIKTWPTFHQLYSFDYYRPEVTLKLKFMACFGMGLVYAGPEALVAFCADVFRAPERVGPWDSDNQEVFDEHRAMVRVAAANLERYMIEAGPRVHQGRSSRSLEVRSSFQLFLEGVDLQLGGEVPPQTAVQREEALDRLFLNEGLAVPSESLDVVLNAVIRLQQAHPVEHRTASFRLEILEARHQSQLESSLLFQNLKYLASFEGRSLFELLGDSYFEQGLPADAGYAYFLALKAVPLDRDPSPRSELAEVRLKRKLSHLRAIIPGNLSETFTAQLVLNAVALRQDDFTYFLKMVTEVPHAELTRPENRVMVALDGRFTSLFEQAPTFSERLNVYYRIESEVLALPTEDNMTKFYLRLKLMESFLKFL